MGYVFQYSCTKIVKNYHVMEFACIFSQKKCEDWPFNACLSCFWGGVQ